MKKILVSSIFLALSLTANAKESSSKPEEPREDASSIQEIMSDVACGPRGKIEEILKLKAGMDPILVTHSDNTGMDMVVFANPKTESSLTIKFSGNFACIMGSGTELLLKYRGGMSL